MSTPIHSQHAKSPSPFRNISDKQSHEAALRKLILEEEKDETEQEVNQSALTPSHEHASDDIEESGSKVMVEFGRSSSTSSR